MKKTALLHAGLSQLVATLGHGDAVVVADAGLPVPAGTPCIDLAVTRGVPSFWQVLDALLSEMQVEHALHAEEWLQHGPQLVQQVRDRLAPAPLAQLPHAEFKARCRGVRTIVRTGECTPYANLMLFSGVVF
ncbi:D-ribose pyranase [Ideonella sp. BN130291]|uniref:D-ribose pyranase n=1 Tax=Ideonella sp. BN130291 TaxID=3112940 RepID=UPI002E263412|nr:D-ribose pyranase [Ideonella sp. BN130291]